MSSLAHKPRVAFQGERGAFSEEAALALLGPEIELVPRRTFAALYGSIDNGDADYVLKVVLRDLKDLSDLVNNVLMPHQSVAHVRSSIVLDRLKETAKLPLKGMRQRA